MNKDFEEFDKWSKDLDNLISRSKNKLDVSFENDLDLSFVAESHLDLFLEWMRGEKRELPKETHPPIIEKPPATLEIDKFKEEDQIELEEQMKIKVRPKRSPRNKTNTIKKSKSQKDKLVPTKMINNDIEKLGKTK